MLVYNNVQKIIKNYILHLKIMLQKIVFMKLNYVLN